MGQDEIVIDLEQRQLLTQPVFTLTRGRATPPDRRYPLSQTQIEPFHKRRVDVPAAGGQDLLHGGLCAEDDAVLHLHEPPPSHSFHPLRIEQLSKRPPARFGHWASSLASRWLHSVPEMRHDGSEGMRVPITQKERHTPRRYQLRDLMQYGLRHCQVRSPTWTLSSTLVSGSIAVQTQWGDRESRSIASAALISPSLTAL